MHHTVARLFTVLLPLLLVAACGGGADIPNSTPVTQVSLAGGGVKGPLADAQVSVFSIEETAADWKGAELDSGTTDSTAAIVDVQIPETISGLVLLEFAADSATVDITTGSAPVISVMRTVVDASRIAAGDLVYASPLTTLAVDIAIANADNAPPFGGNGDGTSSAQEIVIALAIAGQQVASTFGFSLLDNVDIFATPPLLTAETDGGDEQTAVAGYRTAIEAATALIQAITDESLVANPSSGLTNDAILAALAVDLSDGAIDGNADGAVIADLADVVDLNAILTQDPMLLTIPGTAILVGDIETVLVDELATTGVTLDSTPLTDGTASVDPMPANTIPDSDSDTVRDDIDNCVAQANADQLDSDGDTAGDACDLDDDNDQVADSDDAFPLDPAESTDTDGDGVGNNADTDDDNDGVEDGGDAFPLDPDETTDVDGDGVGDNGDTDDDNDGIEDDADNCPLIANPNQVDSNNDGVGDACSGTTNWDNFNWDNANWQ